ncbi:MAG: DUF359 domain-containing protein [Candidatus Parvarchaeota archaeon]|nr:DUF359 domain-containing protein [Candidatus Parvarchaeota archaeon]
MTAPDNELEKLFEECNSIELNKETRALLSGSHGKILSGKEFIGLISKKKNYVITVGDMVTLTAISAGITPNMAIFDLKTERRKINGKQIIKAYKNIERVKNPPGKITKELFYAIRKNMGKKKVGIKISGEEDLAAPLCIVLSDYNDIIAWGVPGKGVNAVKVNEARKKHALSIIKKMHQ